MAQVTFIFNLLMRKYITNFEPRFILWPEHTLTVSVHLYLGCVLTFRNFHVMKNKIETISKRARDGNFRQRYPIFVSLANCMHEWTNNN